MMDMEKTMSLGKGTAAAAVTYLPSVVLLIENLISHLNL